MKCILLPRSRWLGLESQESHCRKHKATKESGSRPLHSHTGTPDRLNTEKIHLPWGGVHDCVKLMLLWPPGLVAEEFGGSLNFFTCNLAQSQLGNEFSCGAAQLVPFRICLQRQAVPLIPVDDGQWAAWYQSWVSHVGNHRCKQLFVHGCVGWAQQRRRHGEMCFDIFLVDNYKTRNKTRTPTRQRQRTQQREGGVHSRAARAALCNRPVMGFPCWSLFLFGVKICQQNFVWGVSGEMPSYGSPMLINWCLSEPKQRGSFTPDWLYSLGQVAACSAVAASTLWTCWLGSTGATPKWRSNCAVATYCLCSRCTATKQWVSHIGNRSCKYYHTEIDRVVLLLVALRGAASSMMRLL